MSQPRLNRRLTLEAPQLLSDGAGGFSQTWDAVGVLWADVSARSGREAALGAAPVSNVTYTITVRATPVGSAQRPCPEHRFRDGSRIFRIEAVSEADADARYLNCVAIEEVVT